MTATVRTRTLDDRLRAVPRPVPILSRETAAGLTSRQRELLDELTELISDGFAHLSMADFASILGCSLRTLYGVAPSRDRLVLAACDRSLWQAGRAARRLVGDLDEADPVEALRRYLRAATRAVNATTPAFSADLDAVPGGRALREAHSQYLIAVTGVLLDVAVERADIRPCHTVVVAHAMAGVASLFIQPEVIPTLPGSPKDAADHIAEIILRGLAVPEPTRERQ